MRRMESDDGSSKKGREREKTPHRGRVNKYVDETRPRAQLDLHGDDVWGVDDAKGRVESFISEQVRRGVERVLIITGKGIHSDSRGPQLKPAIRTFLCKHPLVESVSTARRDRGGDGALEVRLRSRQ